MILTLDPGTKALGWAVFGPDRDLLHCGLAKAPRVTERYIGDAAVAMANEIGFSVPEVYVEEMVVRPSDPKSHAIDLLRVQLVGGIVAGRCGRRVWTVHPMRWKGAVPKRVHQKRILNELWPSEKEILERDTAKIPGGLTHNVIDAIGIGLWATRRLRP